MTSGREIAASPLYPLVFPAGRLRLIMSAVACESKPKRGQDPDDSAGKIKGGWRGKRQDLRLAGLLCAADGGGALTLVSAIA
jgi:hypothetical protein